MTDLAIIETEHRKQGRPSGYTQAIADEIVDRITEGETLADICRDDHMPGYRTVFDWEEKHPDFSANITRARKYGYDQIANGTRRVARGVPGSGTTNDVQRDKLIIETDLKLLAKWDKRYGDKIAHVGGDSAAGDKPIQVLDVTGLSPEQLAVLAGLNIGGE